ncbi:MAG: RagB/SusD family nutrient uptake outer membrane protein [Chitinophagales bacterium]
MKFRTFLITCLAALTVVSCTKLEQKLGSSVVFNPNSGSADAGSLLNGAYNDFNGLVNNQDQIFSLQENTSDECLVPTRGGDWDDNGVWRVLHAHTWTSVHGQMQTVFNGLGQMESDAISTLAAGPTAQQADEALFLRSVAQFYYVDLFGQVPYRLVQDYNSIKAAPVMQPAEAVDTLETVLNGIISRNALPGANVPYRASIDAAKFLLMKVLLNKSAWIAKPSTTFNFDNGDMTTVATLGGQIIASGKYTLTPEYFDNFGPQNAAKGKEAIWSWPNNGSATIGGINSMGINARWMMTLHYNSWDQNNAYGSAGWNGFSTVADFYNSFEGAGAASVDTTKDKRLGGRFYPGVTNQSGLRPGLLVFQQHNEAGNPETDRHGNPLAFTPAVSLVETDKNTLEVTGIRIVKYAPDYNAYTGGNQTNQMQIFRYADVVLMTAEALFRGGDAANALIGINALRAVRGASALASVDAPTLLAERGRELYWEGWRRQDLIRFGVYLNPWALKPSDDAHFLVFPLPSDQLVANPNLKQNPGY